MKRGREAAAAAGAAAAESSGTTRIGGTGVVPDLGQAPEHGVARNFATLFTGEAVARIVAFGATIYIARTLGPSSYGAIAFALAVVLYLSRIADGGMEFFGLGIREIAEDDRRIETVAPDLITARIIIAAILAAGLFAWAPLLPSPDGAVLALYGLTLLTIGTNTRWILLGLERSRYLALARTVGESVMLILVLLLVRGQADVTRVPLAQFAGDSLAALLLLLWLRRRGYRLRVRLRLAVVLPIFRRAAPLVASALLGLMIYNADLIFLRFFRGRADVGYYAAAYTLISFLLNLGVAYGHSLLPAFMRLSEQGERQALFQTAVVQVFAITLPIAAGGALLGPQLMGLVFGSSYGPSTLPLQLLMWTIPLSLVREVAIVALVVNQRQNFVLRFTAWAAGVNIILNLALIPPFGIAGAVVATLATEVVRSFAAIAHVRRDGLRIDGAGRFWRPALATAVMSGVILLLQPATLWLSFAAGVFAFIAVLTVLGGLRFRRGRIPVLSV